MQIALILAGTASLSAGLVIVIMCGVLQRERTKMQERHEAMDKTMANVLREGNRGALKERIRILSICQNEITYGVDTVDLLLKGVEHWAHLANGLPSYVEYAYERACGWVDANTKAAQAVQEIVKRDETVVGK